MTAPLFRTVPLIFDPEHLEPLAIHERSHVEPAVTYRPGGTGELVREVAELVATGTSLHVLPRIDATPHERALALGAALASHNDPYDISHGWMSHNAGDEEAWHTTVLVRADSPGYEAALTAAGVHFDAIEKAARLAASKYVPVIL